MQSLVKQAAILAATTLGGLFLFGCGGSQDRADATVADKINAAEVQQAQGGGRAGAVGALPAFDAAAHAADDPDASDSMKIRAKSASGETYLQAANVLIGKLDEKELLISRLCWDISHLGSDINAGQQLIDAWQQYDPSPIKNDLSKKHDEAAGGADSAVWLAHDSAPVPTLAKVNADIDRLTAAIKSNQDNRAQLVSNRNALLTQSDKIEQQSEAETGRPSVDDFKQSCDLRKQASLVEIQIDGLDAAVVPLQQDLKLAQGQQQVLQEAIQSFSDASDQAGQSWNDIQKQIAAEQQNLQKIYAGSGDAGSGSAGTDALSLTAKAKLLSDNVADADTVRADATKYLQAAIKAFESAAGDATRNAANLRAMMDLIPDHTSNRAMALKLAIDSLNPNAFKVRQAAAEQTLAEVYATQAANLQRRQTLSQTVGAILTKAKLAAPNGMDADLSSQVTDATKNANDHFSAADDLYDKVTTGAVATPDVKVAGATGQIVNQYAWATIDPTGAQGSKGDHLKAATSLVTDGMDPQFVAVIPAALLPPPSASNGANATTGPSDAAPGTSGGAPSPAGNGTAAGPANGAGTSTAGGANNPSTQQ